MIKEIPLRKEFVTIGFSIMDKVPAEYKEMFKSLLVAVDDDEIASMVKSYDDIVEKANSDGQPAIAIMKSFLFLFADCVLSLPNEKDAQKNAGKKQEMTGEEINKAIDTVFNDVVSIRRRRIRPDGDEQRAQKMTGDQLSAKIDKAFNEAGISPSRLRLDGDDIILLDEKDDEGDVITIDPKAIGKTKKPGDGGKTPDGWTTW